MTASIPKAGFAIPLGQWLRGPLREWAEVLLDERRLREEGFLDAAMVRAAWDEHLSERGDWEVHLWMVLMFQAWNENARGHAAAPLAIPAASAR